MKLLHILCIDCSPVSKQLLLHLTIHFFMCDTSLCIVYTLPLSDQQPLCEKTDEVESSVISALSKLLLRLDQNQNMSIFLSIRSWANRGRPAKLITFFRLFICCFFCKSVYIGPDQIRFWLLSHEFILHHSKSVKDYTSCSCWYSFSGCLAEQPQIPEEDHGLDQVESMSNWTHECQRWQMLKVYCIIINLYFHGMTNRCYNTIS